ncbi:MAG: AAA family ATPase [Deltaproteobacteria bacterium]|jgi:hypothetical protein|nr:AAA family ATPase [Deltaproteobacteria bacterium]
MTNTDKVNSALCVGEESFLRLIGHNGVYVDKTGLIYELICGPNGSVPKFLARPRRFGKTLLMDTIQRIFEGRKELFAGLEIERRIGDKWDAFPVIRLSMNNTSPEPALFEESLLQILKESAKTNNHISLKSSHPSGAVMELVNRLTRRYARRIKPSVSGDWTGLKLSEAGNVVLLIDEYDFPLIHNIGKPEGQEEIRLALHAFYSSIKGCANFLRFVLVTGVTKFRQLSVFSGMNNMHDISLNKDYAAICGFTREEIESAFAQHLEPALAGLKLNSEISQDSTKDDLVESLLKWYDGYSWDGDSRVLNPFSVMNFFSNKTV